MAGSPEWKAALREANAVGWLALFALVIVVAASAVYFGGKAEGTANPVAQVETGSQQGRN